MPVGKVHLEEWPEVVTKKKGAKVMTQQFTYMPNLELRLTVTVRFYTSLPVCVCSNTQYLFDCHLG